MFSQVCYEYENCNSQLANKSPTFLLQKKKQVVTAVIELKSVVIVGKGNAIIFNFVHCLLCQMSSKRKHLVNMQPDRLRPDI